MRNAKAGIDRLDQILRRNGVATDSEIYLDFRGWANQLMESIANERRYVVLSPQESERRQRVLRELDLLALHYTGMSFLDVCEVGSQLFREWSIEQNQTQEPIRNTGSLSMSIPTDILNPLIDVLAKLYPDQVSARTMAQTAGLDVQLISFDAKAFNTWNSILDEAEKQHQTQTLLNRAQQQYSRYNDLKVACQAYNNWVTAGRPAAQTDHPPHTSSNAIQPVNATTLSSGKIKILFLAANPSDTTRLRLDEEVRAIDHSLRLAQHRDAFILEQAHAVRVADLQGLLMRYQPHVVHFSGHGSRDGEIIFENESGQAQAVSARALSTLFSVLKDNIRCVVLNACYSEVQAKAIAKNIDCVIGMSTAIGDPAAINFASAFYQALGFGRNIKTAFDLGCNQIDLASLDEQDTPQILALNVDPVTVAFAP